MSNMKKGESATSNDKNFNAFIDFYNKHNVIPVSQNIADVARFIFRRNYLYTTLGTPLSYFRNRSIIEFGPGGGFNAIATSCHRPSLYVFVDASNESLKELHSKNRNGEFNAEAIEIINSNIFDYVDDRKYDYVIIEGTICGQLEPERMLKHVSKFVADGGTLILTTISATSVLSEICRKLLKIKIAATCPDFESQVLMGASIFQTHLANLGTSTRPINDWVIDVIFNDWQKGKYIFSLIDSIGTIGDGFDFYKSSPSFATDDRWYKKVTEASASPNDMIIAQYPNIAACLLDYRVSLNAIQKIDQDISELEYLSRMACGIHDVMLDENNYTKLGEFIDILEEIKKLLPHEFGETVLSIDDFIEKAPKVIDDHKKVEFTHFGKWWGRGQQYVSFLKRHY